MKTKSKHAAIPLWNCTENKTNKAKMKTKNDKAQCASFSKY